MLLFLLAALSMEKKKACFSITAAYLGMIIAQ